MGTERGMDRLIFFTDAVTAIAITLLILPLVDLVPEFAASSSADEGPNNLAHFLSMNSGQLEAFVLSFVVIARLWMANHGLLEHAERPTPLLMWLNIGWAFTVVVLPLPTEIVGTFHTTRLVLALYIGTMALSTIFLAAIALVIYLRPEIESAGDTEKITRLYGTGSTAVFQLLALAIAVTFPNLTYWPLLLLFVSGPLDRIIKPRLRRWDAAKQAAATAN
jgi:uncharacterized membrane protein